MRFYPDYVPPFEYEPTRERFAVDHLDDDLGNAVVSLMDFQPRDVLFVFTGFLVDHVTQFSLQLTANWHIHDPFFAGMLMHSCEPNAIIIPDRHICVAQKQIRGREIITIDYEGTEEQLFRPFTCRCGTSKCRGRIGGRRYYAREGIT